MIRYFLRKFEMMEGPVERQRLRQAARLVIPRFDSEQTIILNGLTRLIKHASTQKKEVEVWKLFLKGKQIKVDCNNRRERRNQEVEVEIAARTAAIMSVRETRP